MGRLSYTNKQHKKLASLCAGDGVYWNFSGFVLPRALAGRTDTVAAVLCSDVFREGADEEPIATKDVNWVSRIYDAFGEMGLIAWVSYKRNTAPLGTNHEHYDWLVNTVGEMRE